MDVLEDNALALNLRSQSLQLPHSSHERHRTQKSKQLSMEPPADSYVIVPYKQVTAASLQHASHVHKTRSVSVSLSLSLSLSLSVSPAVYFGMDLPPSMSGSVPQDDAARSAPGRKHAMVLQTSFFKGFP